MRMAYFNVNGSRCNKKNDNKQGCLDFFLFYGFIVFQFHTVLLVYNLIGCGGDIRLQVSQEHISAR